MERTQSNQQDADARANRILWAFYAATEGQLPSEVELYHLAGFAGMLPFAVQQWYAKPAQPRRLFSKMNWQYCQSCHLQLKVIHGVHT